MDIHTATECAYKNGYEQGKKEAIAHGRWIIPTKIGIRSFNIPHCSVCDGVPCGVDEHTKFCPNCGAKMDLEGE